MESLKFVDNLELNQKIVNIVGQLRKELVEIFRPKSIVISASFATGEAVAFKQEDDIKFLSDCEVAILPNWHIFNRKRIVDYTVKFYQKTGLKVEISGVTLTLYLMLPFLHHKIKPTMDNYNIKHGAKVIYGRDYLNKMPDFKPKDIPLWEVVRLVFNRMAEALTHFAPDNPSSEMVFWTDKIILACQDSLLLSCGEYHHQYGERNRLFNKLMSRNLTELRNIPDLTALATEATERRLKGIMTVKEPVAYWFEVQDICDGVFRHIIARYNGISFGSYLDFQRQYLAGIQINPMRQLCYALKKLLISRRLNASVQILRNLKPHDHIIYSLIPLVYFGLSRDLSINESYVNRIVEVLPSTRKTVKPGNSILDTYKYLQCSIYRELIG
ncbi:hypothetical protein ACFLWF_00695 [Chloroflexota bacterium]